jgi:hypothetical protein
LFAAAFEPLVLSKMSGDKVFRSRPGTADPAPHPEIVATMEQGARFRRPLLIFGKPISLSSVSPGGLSEILPAALAMKLRPIRDPYFSLLNTAPQSSEGASGENTEGRFG